MTVLIGCSIGGTNWNEHIDAESRDQIKTHNDKIVEALNENDSKKLITVFSDQLKAKTNAQDLETFVKTAHEAVPTKEYSLLDEYLTQKSSVGSIATVFKGVSGEYDYSVNYEVLTKDSYVSLVKIGGPEGEVLLTCIYGKYENDWKLNVLRIGEYSYFGKNAIDFYKQAKTNYASGNLIDAANNMEVAKKIGLPGENYFHYQKETEIKDFATKVFSEANAKFPMPMKISEIETHPQIFKVSPKPISEGIFPMVTYISKIDLKDTVALKKENEELKKIIGTIFPGIEKGKKYVFFQAYNDIPSGNTPTEHYGFALVSEGQ